MNDRPAPTGLSGPGPSSEDAPAAAFPGDSELARLMRAHDWSATPLGPPETWPEGLKVPLRMALMSRFEMWLGWGPDLCFFYNDAYVPTLGLKHPAALGRPFREVWREVYADVEDQVRSVMEDGRPSWNKALLLLLERSGYPEETYHTFSYSPLMNDGRVEGLMCVVTEETERVISERRLGWLRTLADALIGARAREAVRDGALDALAQNRRDFPFALLYLREPDGGWRGGAATPDAAPLVGADWGLDTLTQGETRPLPADLAAPAGPWPQPPREVWIVPIAGAADGQPAGALVLGLNPMRARDASLDAFVPLITGQIAAALRQAETLESERRRADRIWTNARDLLVVVDPAGIFRSVSPSWTRILGHPIEDVVGRPYTEFLDPADLAATAAALAAASSGAELTAFENRYVARSGAARWISWHSSLEGGLVYVNGRDVTEERRQREALGAAEEALRQSQKMEAIGQLTGGVAHDFNNLLTGITGSLELMQARAAQGRLDGVERYMLAAQSAAKRAAALTQRLLAFSRRQTLDPTPTDLNRLVGGMDDLVRRTVGPGITVEFVSAGGLWTTLVDQSQLDNALLNLCINARDAMPDGGRLTIETANKWLDERSARERDLPPGQYVSLCVSDTGTGMTPDVIGRAFEPFFTTKPLGSGTGLGLSMIYGFVRQSGGQVRIYSEIGQGSTLCLYLPRHDGAGPADDPLAVLPSAAASATGRTVLVVDDEPTIRMLLADVLDAAGHAAIEAGDGPTALRILDSGLRIDLLVTDVGLPGGLNGRQVADAARVRQPDLRVLFITGYAENAVIANGQIEPGMAVLTKPFSMDDLAHKVTTLLEGLG